MSIENCLRVVPAGTYKRAESGKMTRRDFDLLDEIVTGCEEVQSLATNYSMVLSSY